MYQEKKSHNFKEVYNEEETWPDGKIPVDEAKTILQHVPVGLNYQYASNEATKVLNKMKEYKRTYIYHICRDCGMKVTKS